MTTSKNHNICCSYQQATKIGAELIARGYVDSAKKKPTLAAHTNQQQNSCRNNRMGLHGFCKKTLCRDDEEITIKL